MKVKVKKLDERAILPTRGSSSAAGWDLYALSTEEPTVIQGSKTELIHTGIAMEIPEGYFGAIYARSGLATKQGIRPANCVGIIDSDYRGEIMIAAHSDCCPVMSYFKELGNGMGPWEVSKDPNSTRIINGGERIAQLIIQKYDPVEFEEVEELDQTERGEGGFGSTGTK